MSTSEDHRGTAESITQTTNKVEHDVTSYHTNCSKIDMKEDLEYTIDPVVHHGGKGANSRYTI